MSFPLWRLTALVCLGLCPVLFADPPPTTLNQLQLESWEFISPEPMAIDAVIVPGAEDIVRMAGKPMGYLQTRASFANYDLHVEWRWTHTPGNGGILLHIDSGPIDRHLWPRCLQVQTKHSRAGDLLPMAGASFAESLTTPPGAKTPQLDRRAESSENPAGEWNSCDIRCRGGVTEVHINGVLQNRVTGCSPAAGRVGFQLEGAPYELRAVRITPAP